MEHITIPAQIDKLDVLQDFISALMPDEKVLNNVLIAAEEIFVNIAHYAYTPDTGDVFVDADINQNHIILEFRDSGKPYDPVNRIDPDTSLSAEEREIGGLGIFMVKKLMDEVRYEYRDGENCLTICKNM